MASFKTPTNIKNSLILAQKIKMCTEAFANILSYQEGQTCYSNMLCIKKVTLSTVAYYV
jgi:hypothetical protein